MVKYRLTKKGKLVVVLLCSFITLSITLGVSLSKDKLVQGDYSGIDSSKANSYSKPKPQLEPTAPVQTDENLSKQSAEPPVNQKISVFFDANATSMNDKYYNDLNVFTEAALQHEDSNIQIEGNCATLYDSDQSKIHRSDNYNLSLDRAQSVASYLNGKGIAHDRLIIIANGSDKPLKDNTTPAGRIFNRRVDIFLINK